MSDDDFNLRNIAEFRANHGMLGGPFEGAPVLLLHSTGARSGEERVNPMMYPAWYWNLIAHPGASIEGYQNKTTRVIPVLALTPRGSDGV